jgi:hypothetical protein
MLQYVFDEIVFRELGSVPNVLSNHVKPFHRESFGNKPHTFGTLPIHDPKKRVGF